MHLHLGSQLVTPKTNLHYTTVTHERSSGLTLLPNTNVLHGLFTQAGRISFPTGYQKQRQSWEACRNKHTLRTRGKRDELRGRNLFAKNVSSFICGGTWPKAWWKFYSYSSVLSYSFFTDYHIFLRIISTCRKRYLSWKNLLLPQQ